MNAFFFLQINDVFGLVLITFTFRVLLLGDLVLGSMCTALGTKTKLPFQLVVLSASDLNL